jgi:hypothetical protein
VGFSLGLNGGIITKTVEPENFGVATEPGHLSFGVLSGAEGSVGDGLRLGDLACETGMGLSITD